MKLKVTKDLLLAALLLGISLFAVTIGMIISFSSEPESPAVSPTAVDKQSPPAVKPIDMGELHLLTGQTVEFEYEALSNDAAVAVYENGELTAVGEGSTELTAAAEDGQQMRWTVSVHEYTAMKIPMGRTTAITAEIALSDWQCDDDNVLEVNKNGLLTPAAVGNCRVTAVDANGRLFGWNVEVSKVAYLTFDDWPNKNTVSILETLDNYNVKATFFVVRRANELEYYQMVIDAGHAIGNHAAVHEWDELYTNADHVVACFAKMDDWLMDKFSVSTKLLRYPSGSVGGSYQQVKKKAYRKLVEKGYRIFDWTSSIGDTDSFENKVVLNNALKGIKKDVEIVLMHNKKTTAAVLPTIIEHLLENNYMLLPLDEQCPTYSFIGGWQE